MLSLRKPEAFQRCFQNWFAERFTIDASETRHMTIDDKTLRRSHDRYYYLAKWPGRKAIGLLKQHPSQHCIKGKQQIAG